MEIALAQMDISLGQPRGLTVAEAGENEELLTAKIRMEEVDQVRSEIPVFADRRPEIYERVYFRCEN